MCCGSESQKSAQSLTSSSSISSDENRASNTTMMNHLTVETEDTFSSLLELAANNDVDGFKRSIERDPNSVDEAGLWYGRLKGSKAMANEQRTPLMVASTYGSIDIVRIILSVSAGDVNRQCGLDRSTALHCAASSGADNAIDVVKLLLLAGADPNLTDGDGQSPFEVIVVSPKLTDVKSSLEELLKTNNNNSTVSTNSPPLSFSSENGSPLAPDFVSSPKSNAMERKEYPIDPSIPDIKNGIYSTDEFRMYSFKVRPCSRAYSHDWTECPFVHPGENARRRDPRKFHYSCVPCPEFRKGACRRGDMCEYAHGVFECWLHPAQYRTRLCKDGPGCARRVCFFAHAHEELRPLYVSTGSAVPSPRAGTAAMDFAAAMSPSSVMSPGPFTPPMSPSGNGGCWPQPNVPALHLPGSNFQSSRLRSSLNARDIPVDDYEQLMNEFSCLNSSLNRSGRMTMKGSLAPSNLDDLFSAEGSPRFSPVEAAIFSPTHKSALINQFQLQQQSGLSPINTGFSPKAASSSAYMSPRAMEPISPMGSRVSLLAQREKYQQFRSLSSRELGSNSASVHDSPSHSWSKWGSSNGEADWAVSADDFGKLRRSSSFELGNHNDGEEPDLSWVQSLVKESPTEAIEKSSGPRAISVSNERALNGKSPIESVDNAVLGAWLEQMQIDHFVAQKN